MIKLVIVGIFGLVMMAGGILTELSLRKNLVADDADTTRKAEVEQVATEMQGAPIIVDGKVEGYVVFRINSQIDRSKLSDSKMDVAPFLLDATFSATYRYFDKGIPNIRPDDISQITSLVASYANKKLGADVVRSVEMEQFNYVPRDKVRENMFAKSP